jgi:hypothetical protein
VEEWRAHPEMKKKRGSRAELADIEQLEKSEDET